MLGAIAGAFSKPVLRLVIRNARRLSHDDAERERAAAAAKRWLFSQIGKRRAATVTPTAETAPGEPLTPERLAG
jgi:hypothetical protein